MNYLYQLEEKRRMLKSMIKAKEEEFTNCISSSSPSTNENNIISKISNKLSLLASFTDGIRVGISLFKLFNK